MLVGSRVRRRGRMTVARMLLPELSAIHDQFLALSQSGPPLGGKLLLRSQLDADGIAAVVAASVAGAASLCVDADAERLREGLRAGFVDFVVANLDEALRILKNEIRRARAISVGLTADPEPCIDAMIERGLQPDFVSNVSQASARIFKERGAIELPGQSAAEPGTSLLEWSVAENPTANMRRIAERAAASLDPTRADTALRLRWIEQSPRYLGRSFAARQCLRMTAREGAAFLAHVLAAVPAIKITLDGQPV